MQLDRYASLELVKHALCVQGHFKVFISYSITRAHQSPYSNYEQLISSELKNICTYLYYFLRLTIGRKVLFKSLVQTCKFGFDHHSQIIVIPRSR